MDRCDPGLGCRRDARSIQVHDVPCSQRSTTAACIFAVVPLSLAELGSLAEGFQTDHTQKFRDHIPSLSRDALLETCHVLAFTYELMEKVASDCKTTDANSRWNQKLQEVMPDPLACKWTDLLFSASDTQAAVIKLLNDLVPQLRV